MKSCLISWRTNSDVKNVLRVPIKFILPVEQWNKKKYALALHRTTENESLSGEEFFFRAFRAWIHYRVKNRNERLLWNVCHESQETNIHKRERVREKSMCVKYISVIAFSRHPTPFAHILWHEQKRREAKIPLARKTQRFMSLVVPLHKFMQNIYCYAFFHSSTLKFNFTFLLNIHLNSKRFHHNCRCKS